MFNYKNIGKKIKILAVICFIILLILGLFASIYLLWFFLKSNNRIGIVVLAWSFVAYPTLAWISTFILYGYGELIDKATQIEENTRPINTDKNTNENIIV